MVVPKMTRPAMLRAPEPIKPQSPPPPEPKSSPQPPAAVKTPAVSLVKKSDDRVSAPFAWAAILTTLLGTAALGWLTLPSGGDGAASKPIWISARAIFAPASKQQRQLLFYRGSRQASNFQIDFNWTPDDKGAGLIFRCVDRANYQALRIAIAPSRPTRGLYAEHFAVIAGVETEHKRRLIPWKPRDGTIHIAVDGADSSFTLSVQGKKFESWTDDRLKKGDVGFFTNSNEHVSIDAIRFTFANHELVDFLGNFPSQATALID